MKSLHILLCRIGNMFKNGKMSYHFAISLKTRSLYALRGAGAPSPPRGAEVSRGSRPASAPPLLICKSTIQLERGHFVSRERIVQLGTADLPTPPPSSNQERREHRSDAPVELSRPASVGSAVSRVGPPAARSNFALPFLDCINQSINEKIREL